MKKVLCCMCSLFILLFFSSCVTQVKNQSDSISTIIIPASYIRFCGIEQDEYIESYPLEQCIGIKADGEDVVINMTESQRQNIINQTEQFIDDFLEDYYKYNSEYKFHGSDDYKKAEFYYDEKFSFSEMGSILGVLGEYGQMQLLTNNSGDWNVEVKIYNCHTGKLVSEGTVPYDHMKWTLDD